MPTLSRPNQAQDYTWLCRQTFGPGQVVCSWVESGRVLVPEVERAIELAWATQSARPGVTLFDGPIARCEGFFVRGDQLHLELSPTSYRVAVGTHFCNPHFRESIGPQVMANSIGVSTGLICADGHLVMGVRTQTVAYYPGRVHPFAGSLEVRQPLDVFEDARRELAEEVNLEPGQIDRLRCVGIAQDQALLHPELIFLATTPLTFARLARQLDGEEHTELVAVDIRSRPNVNDLAGLTPIARAVVEAAVEAVVEAGVEAGEEANR